MRLAFLDKLPINPSELLKHGTELDKERALPLRIAILVERDAPDELLLAVEAEFVAHTAHVEISVDIAEDRVIPIPSLTDAVIGLVGGGGSAVAAAMADSRRRAIPTVALHVGDGTVVTASHIGQPLDDFLSGPDAEALVRFDLGRWLCDKLPAKRLALAANFGFMRRAVSTVYVKNTALQNALIGGVTIFPGTDMPLMTANQAKMLLQIAAAFGEPLGTERITELGVVVGGGFAFRAVARQLLDFVPGFGWIVKGGIGYTGTIAMGMAAIKYFEEGASLGDVSRKLVDRAGELAKQRRTARHAALSPVEPAPYELEPADAGDGVS